MDSLYLILLALFLLVIIPWIMRQRRLAAVRHILNQKKQNKENREMKELAKRFIGEECIIYTITSNDGSVQGVIKEIDDGGMVIEKKTGELAAPVEVISRGFVYLKNSEELVKDARALVNELAAQFGSAHRSEWSSIKNNIRSSLKTFLYNKTKRTPMIFPIIIEID